jgi:hypothetical protein
MFHSKSTKNSISFIQKYSLLLLKRMEGTLQNCTLSIAYSEPITSKAYFVNKEKEYEDCICHAIYTPAPITSTT